MSVKEYDKHSNFEKIIKGKLLILPKCTCGKCLLKKEKTTKNTDHFSRINNYPFYKNARTTYKRDFNDNKINFNPNDASNVEKYSRFKSFKDDYFKNNCPLKGISNNRESYPRYNEKTYLSNKISYSNGNNNPLKNNKEKLDKRTTYNQSYINYWKEGKKTDLPEKNLIKHARVKSTYENDYIKYNENICELRKWLDSRKMKYINV